MHDSKRPRVSKPESPDGFLESYLALPSQSLVKSFNHLIKSSPSDTDQAYFVERAVMLGSVLMEAGKHHARIRATYHNSISWPFLVDLTIKIFSLTDTRSVCYAAAACSFFRKCAEHPLCYSNIDLVTRHAMVNDQVVSQMIQRAGEALQSFRFGTVIPSAPSSNTTGFGPRGLLTNPCLSFLSMDGGALGSNLKRLHLYNVQIDGESYDKALSACPALLDLAIVAFKVELGQILESLSKHCPLIQRLHLESTMTNSMMPNSVMTNSMMPNSLMTNSLMTNSMMPNSVMTNSMRANSVMTNSMRPNSVMTNSMMRSSMMRNSMRTNNGDELELEACADLISSCPHLASLALKGFELHDNNIRLLFMGLWELRYVDLSRSSITGTFLRNLGTNAGGKFLEVLILQNCFHLQQVEVSNFLTAVTGGSFKLLEHVDISVRECNGQVCRFAGWCCSSKNFVPPQQLFEVRPRFQLRTNFFPACKSTELKQIHMG